jgi:hypothetical protein
MNLSFNVFIMIVKFIFVFSIKFINNLVNHSMPTHVILTHFQLPILVDILKFSPDGSTTSSFIISAGCQVSTENILMKGDTRIHSKD